MPGIPANQFSGRPISPDNGQVFLNSYVHTKTPNRHVDVKFLQKRNIMKENKVAQGNKNQIIEDSLALTSSDRKVSFHHLATEFLI